MYTLLDPNDNYKHPINTLVHVCIHSVCVYVSVGVFRVFVGVHMLSVGVHMVSVVVHGLSINVYRIILVLTPCL